MIGVGILAGQEAPAASVPTFRAWGAAGAATTAPSFAAVTGAESSDYLVCLVGSKPYNSTPTSATYTQIGSIASGTTGSGIGSGSVLMTAFYETGSPGSCPITNTSGTVTMGRQAAVYSTGAPLSAPVAYMLADTSETGTGVSATNTGTTPDITAGDVLLIGVVMKDDGVSHASQSLTVPGCTVGAITWETRYTTTTGDDGALHVGRATVTAGTCSGWPTYSATAASGSSATAVAVVRVR